MLFPLIVVGFWLGGCFLISCMGWRWFARKYPTGDRGRMQPEGTVHLVPSVKFEFVGSYRNSVRAVITKEGIYFSVPFMLRVFHAPFLLPWTSVRRIRKKAGFKQRGKRLIVEVEDEEGPIRLLLSKEMEEDFLKYYWPQKPKPIARRAFPKDQPQENPEGESVGATVGVAESANENENKNANPGAGIDAEVEVNTIPATYPSLFTIVGMGMQAGGSSGAKAPPVSVGAPVPVSAPVSVGAPVYAKVNVSAPIPAAAPPPMPVPAPVPAPAPAPEPTVSFYVPKTVPVTVPMLATITATVAAASATLMAEPRS
ncbi:hypothetical protein G5S37_29630 [Roseimicrobium sp. ORNL1]|nr:hypothetical protein G5S37_29630 [Roseimicrobium sp. ORNL1]